MAIRIAAYDSPLRIVGVAQCLGPGTFSVQWCLIRSSSDSAQTVRDDCFDAAADICDLRAFMARTSYVRSRSAVRRTVYYKRTRIRFGMKRG